ncbi:MAG: cellulase N-terminal Ig-like domain-containing protein, partial [Chromatiaceae bacterium]
MTRTAPLGLALRRRVGPIGMGLWLVAGGACSEPPATEDQVGITSPLAWSPAVLAASQVETRPAAGVRYLETRSDRAISLGLEGLDHTHVTADLQRYRLSSPTDPRYREPIGAMGAGSDQQVVGLTGKRQPIIEARLHLLFPHPLQPGHEYRLDVSSAPGADGRPLGPALAALRLAYQPERRSGSVQVNQVGYAPHAKKFAYLGNWLGTLGPLPLDRTSFEVVDVHSGQPVFAGEARLRAGADPWSGHDVHEADFSALTTPGRYRLRVAGLGVSDAFDIKPEVYAPIYRTVMRLFYHSRNATPILAPWADAGYERPEGGVPARLDGVFHPAVGTSPLGRGEPAGGRHPVSQGWFDAGDFGQYVVNAGPVWYQIGAALDIA